MSVSTGHAESELAVTKHTTFNLLSGFLKVWLKPYWSFWILAAICVMALFLRLYKLDVPSFFRGYDEGWSFLNSAYRLPQIMAFLPPDHSPLFFLLNHFWLDLTGYTHNRFVLRLPTVITGTLLVAATYMLAREVSNNLKVALLAAFTLAIVPFQVDMSRAFRMYSLLALLGVLAAYFLLRALRCNRRWDWLAFVLCSILNLYNHYDALLATLQLATFGLLWLVLNMISNVQSSHLPKFIASWVKADLPLKFNLRQTWKLGLAGLISFGLIGLLYLPWLSHLLSFVNAPGYGLNRGEAKATLDWASFYKFVSETTFGYDLGFWLGLPLALLGLGYLLVRRFYYGLFCGCYFWLMLLIITNAPRSSSNYLLASPRYYCWVTPVFMLMLGQGIWLLGSWTARGAYWMWAKPQMRHVAIVPTVLILVLLGNESAQIYKSYQLYQPQRTYLEDTTDFLTGNLRSGDLVLTAAPYFESDTVKRNYYISQTLIYLATNNESQQARWWPYFLEYEQLNSYDRLQQLKNSTANLWLLTVLDGSDSEIAAKKQQIAKINTDKFSNRCFGLICLVKVNANISLTQYAALKSLLQTYSFMNNDFANEVARLSNLENKSLEPVAINTLALAVAADATAQTILPVMPNQIYYVKFSYNGQPSKIFIEPQTPTHQSLETWPDKHGYTPPPNFGSQLLSDGIIFEVPDGGTTALLRALGEFGAYNVSNIQLFELK